ncbi:atherin-like [Octodon degus]|uniref:Atherin-like n=1 Tax=Octodon degus TaxID=10160 RepID=A0A6P6E9Q9_OCTDE|nr:atherin-like [Octodon degus]
MGEVQETETREKGVVRRLNSPRYAGRPRPACRDARGARGAQAAASARVRALPVGASAPPPAPWHTAAKGSRASRAAGGGAHVPEAGPACAHCPARAARPGLRDGARTTPPRGRLFPNSLTRARAAATLASRSPEAFGPLPWSG